MKIVAYIFAAFLLFGLIGAAIKLLICVTIAGMVLGFVAHPRESISMLGIFATIALIARFPVIGAIAVLALCIIGAIHKKRADAGTQP